jgi:hypothetical protein
VRVGQILTSPIAKEYMAGLVATQERAMLVDPVSEVKAELDRQALPSVRRIVKLRDAADSGARIQLNAANSLLDRTVPRKIQQAPPAPTFVLPDQVAERLLKVLAETNKLDAAIDVTPSEASDTDVATIEPTPHDSD